MSLRAAAAGLKWASIAKVACQCVTWIITLVVIRLLDPADYGATAVAAVFVSLLATIAELGLGAALVQARELDDAAVGRVAAASITLNSICAAVLVATSPLLGWFYDDPRIGTIVSVSSLSLVMTSLVTVPESLLYREMDFKRIALLEVASAVSASLATLLMATGGLGVWSLVLGPLCGLAMRAALVTRLSRWVRPRFSLEGLKGHLRFGGELTGGRLAWQASQQCDVVIGGHLMSEAALGLYTVSVHLARMPLNKVMSVINQVAFPAVARLQSERDALAAHTVQAIRLLAFLAVPLLWGLSSVAPELIIVILGDHWARASLPLQIAAAAMPVQLLSNMMSTVLTGLGRADVELRNMLTTLALTALGVFVGAQSGVVGLTAGWSIAAVAALLFNLPRTTRVIGIDARGILSALWAPMLAGAFMYATVSALRPMMGSVQDLWRLAALVAAGGGAYVVAITLLSPGIWATTRRMLVAVRTA